MKKGLILTVAGVVATAFGIGALLKKNDENIENEVELIDCDYDEAEFSEDDVTEE